MDFSRDYVNAALSSRIVQDKWVPGMYDLVYNPKKDEFFYLSWDDYLKIVKNPDLLKQILWVPQSGSYSSLYQSIKEPKYPHVDGAKLRKLSHEFDEEYEALIKEDRLKYANFERIMKTEERQKLYYIYKKFEQKDFPGIVLLTNN